MNHKKELLRSLWVNYLRPKAQLHRLRVRNCRPDLQIGVKKGKTLTPQVPGALGL